MRQIFDNSKIRDKKLVTTANQRKAGGILNREEARNYFYVLMSFLNRELRE